ncbi:MAG: hypothetical protein PHQ27_06900, partial [Victivallales bacterium]|nr:hypothetical protein [Victivallales bacterium]
MTGNSKHILFVCTGNTCRSPMCEAYLRHLCRRAGQSGLVIASAGIAAGGGFPASPHCIDVMAQIGVAMDRFRNTQLTAALLEQADLIIDMTKRHRRHIAAMSPPAAGKTRLLLEFAGEDD